MKAKETYAGTYKMSEDEKGYIVESFELPQGLSQEIETIIMLKAHHSMSKGKMLNLCTENRGVHNTLLQDFEFTILRDAISAPKKTDEPQWKEPTSPYVEKGKYHSDWPAANKGNNSLFRQALQNTTKPHNFSPQGGDEVTASHEHISDEAVVLGDVTFAD